jgi:hypothetical protein
MRACIAPCSQLFAQLFAHLHVALCTHTPERAPALSCAPCDTVHTHQSTASQQAGPLTCNHRLWKRVGPQPSPLSSSVSSLVLVCLLPPPNSLFRNPAGRPSTLILAVSIGVACGRVVWKAERGEDGLGQYGSYARELPSPHGRSSCTRVAEVLHDREESGSTKRRRRLTTLREPLTPLDSVRRCR